MIDAIGAEIINAVVPNLNNPTEQEIYNLLATTVMRRLALKELVNQIFLHGT